MLGFLYGQTEYNMLENSMHIVDYVKYGKLYGYSFLSITDKNMHGHYKFYKECVKNDIKPIIGLEIRINDTIILGYALNINGYKNLMKISTYVVDNRVDLDVLEKYRNGIYFILVDNSIIKFVNDNKVNDALDIYESFKSKLKNVGIGLTYNDIVLYNSLIDKDISLFPIAKINYLLKNDYKAYTYLCRIGNKNIEPEGHELKNCNELQEMFSNMPDIFKNLEKLVGYVNLDLMERKIALPKYPTPNKKSSKEYLKELSTLGLNKRLSGYNVDKKIYLERLDYELGIVDQMGYNDYFLIVWDFIKYAKMNKILVGPGRGSGAGSLVAWAIGITNINPLKYDLLFERFLNPGRITMPDIDTDFPDDKRNDVINHVKDLYKKNHVCSISAFDTFKIKSIIRDLAKLNKIDENRIRELAKVAEEAMKNNEYETLINESGGITKEILLVASKLINLPRHISTHPAGIIVSDDDLLDTIPLFSGTNDLYQSQLDATDLEELGLLKIDFLGLRNLNIINNIISYIPKFNNLNIYDVPKNDEATYSLLRSGDTSGIFQLDNEGITRVLKKLKPTRFNDLVALLALYRPGPMDNIDEFIDRKNGKEFSYIHSDLEPILKDTYGIIVYQEQIMRICLKFAGYSLGEADILRRAVSKKKEDILIKERQRFLKSSTSLGYSNEVANKIYDDIVKFANYGFNKSHSVAYATLTYVMAYLKANYKKEFIMSQLNNSIGNIEETIKYYNYAKQNNIKIVGPNVNISTTEYVLFKDYLFMPLNSIKGVGRKDAIEIANNRNRSYKGIMDIKIRTNINDETLKALVYAGACDSFKQTKKSLIEAIDSVNSVVDKYINADKKEVTIEEYDFEYLKEMELNTLGMNIKYNIFRNINRLLKDNHARRIKPIILNQSFNTIIKFDHIKEIMTKNGDIMLVGSANDGETIMDFVIFPEDYDKFRGSLLKTNLYLIYGQIKSRNDRNNLIINIIQRQIDPTK